jgi:hypothetical protein
MGSVPTVRTWEDYPSPNSLLTYAEYGQSIFDVIDFLMNPPIVHVMAQGSTTIATGATVAISFNKVIVDTHGFFNSSNPTRITPTIPGWYKGWGGVSFAPNATSNAGVRRMLVRHSTDAFVMRRDSRAPVNTGDDAMYKGMRFIYKVNGTTEYLELHAFQDSGNSITNVNTGTQNNCPEKYPEFFLRWWKPL